MLKGEEKDLRLWSQRDWAQIRLCHPPAVGPWAGLIVLFLPAAAAAKSL